MILKLHLRSILFFVVLFNLTVLSAQQDGSVDPTFNPVDVGWHNRLVGSVYEMKEQSDGKVLIVGQISRYLGQPVNNIVRLNADETLDTTFNPGTGTNGLIWDVLPLPDGKIIITGEFTTYNGTARKNIARLNSDGSLDNSFNSNSIITELITQPHLLSDGKIIITYYSQYSNKVARLNADGSLDILYNIGNAIDTQVFYIDIDNSGKVLASGRFSGISESSPYRLIRLNTDGTQDTSFNVVFPSATTYGAYEFVIQQTGKIVILEDTNNGSKLLRFNADGTADNAFQTPTDFQGEYFSGLRPYVNDKLIIHHNGIKILNSEGGLDTSFTTPDSAGLNLGSLGVSPTGKIYVAGNFVSINGALDNGIARLNGDGSRDNTFNTGPGIVTGADSAVGKVLMQNDNKLIITGTFQSYNGVMRNRAVRLNQDGTLDNSFTLDSSINSLSLNFLHQYPDGKILVASEGKIKRINHDGSVDPTFITEQFAGEDNAAGIITDVVVLPNGKIIVIGYFIQYGTTPAISICRLNSDGSLDSTFSTNALSGASVVKVVHLPQEQKIVIASISASSAFIKINYDGVQDPTFVNTPNAVMFWPESFAVEADGKIIASGFGDGVPYYKQRLVRFNANGTVNQILSEVDYQGQTVINIISSPDGKYYVIGRPNYGPLAGATFARFNQNNTLDNTFTPAIAPNINTIAFQGNSIVVAGGFHNYNGTAKNNIIRLHTSGLLSTDDFQSGTENAIIYRQNNDIKISAESTIQSVDIFDLQGRLISKASDVHNTNVSLPVVQKGAILIVKVTHTDGAVVTKKIY